MAEGYQIGAISANEGRKRGLLVDLICFCADMTGIRRRISTWHEEKGMQTVNERNLTQETYTAKPAAPGVRPAQFSISGRIRSFRYAINGIALMLKSQHNAWLHATASIAVILVGVFFHISSSEWCWLVLAIMAVWTAEALNTALEFLADVASPEFHPLVKSAKDVAAGAVLISAAGSVVIALLVFSPHILAYLHSAK